MSLMILELENELVNLILPIGKLHNAKVEALPEDWSKIGGKPHQFSQIWVRFNGQSSEGQTVKINNIKFALVVSAKRLRGHQSLYAILEDLSAQVNGMVLLNSKPIMVDGISGCEYEDGTWTATIDLSIKLFTKGICQI